MPKVKAKVPTITFIIKLKGNNHQVCSFKDTYNYLNNCFHFHTYRTINGHFLSVLWGFFFGGGGAVAIYKWDEFGWKWVTCRSVKTDQMNAQQSCAQGTCTKKQIAVCHYHPLTIFMTIKNATSASMFGNHSFLIKSHVPLNMQPTRPVPAVGYCGNRLRPPLVGACTTSQTEPPPRLHLLGANWRPWHLKLKLSLSQKVGCVAKVVTQSVHLGWCTRLVYFLWQ